MLRRDRDSRDTLHLSQNTSNFCGCNASRSIEATWTEKLVSLLFWMTDFSMWLFNSGAKWRVQKESPLIGETCTKTWHFWFTWNPLLSLEVCRHNIMWWMNKKPTKLHTTSITMFKRFSIFFPLLCVFISIFSDQEGTTQDGTFSKYPLRWYHHITFPLTTWKKGNLFRLYK